MKTKTVKTDWNVKELETFFSNVMLPAPPIKLNPVYTITNVKGFVDFPLDIINLFSGKESFRPYLYRLQQLKFLLEKLK